MTPDVLIIGTQRGGTSSLFQYLSRHPDVVRSVRKEVEYFSTDHAKGWTWYRAHFPLRLRAALHRLVFRRRLIAFEATPDYLLMPQVAERVAEELPDAKIIALLRDPIERTYSGYKHMMRYGLEERSFAEALQAEPRVLEEELPRIEADPDYDAVPYRRYAYAHRGLYADQLAPWVERFAPDRLLVLEAEELFEDEPGTYLRVLEYLGLRRWLPAEFHNHSNLAPVPAPSKIDPEVRSRLEDYFRPHNEKLEKLLDRPFRWS
jgi:hypothetical protein